MNLDKSINRSIDTLKLTLNQLDKLPIDAVKCTVNSIQLPENTTVTYLI